MVESQEEGYQLQISNQGPGLSSAGSLTIIATHELARGEKQDQISTCTSKHRWLREENFLNKWQTHHFHCPGRILSRELLHQHSEQLGRELVLPVLAEPTPPSWQGHVAVAAALVCLIQELMT